MSHKLTKTVLGVISFVTVVALACGSASPTATPLPPPTPVPPTPTTAPTDTPPPPPTAVPAAPTAEVVTTLPPDEGTTSFTGGYDDFSEDTGAWEIFPGAQIADGIFSLGPFENCADVGTNQPFGCFSQCLACGRVSEYDMQVDAAYLSGVTDRTFGMVLRFVDENGDGLVDPEDYYLDFELSIYDQYFVIWEHMDGGWTTVANSFEGSIKPGKNVNTLRAVAAGNEMDLYVNGNWVNGVTGVPFLAGTVGLVVGGRAIQAGFDDFSIEIP